MYQKTKLFCLAALFVLLIAASRTLAQESDAGLKSIKRMEDRISAIESEMKQSDAAKAAELGDEIFGLLTQIDSTFLDMKTDYQQQVISLNRRMQLAWQELEQSEELSRATINKQLKQLETEWDQTFEKLKHAHDEHLDQLASRLRSIKSEFYSAAGHAKADLESKNIEASADWEKAHEVFLAVNLTYTGIVGDQLEWMRERALSLPKNQELKNSLASVRTRYRNVLSRFQKRLNVHLQHLDAEVVARQAQLPVLSNWKKKSAVIAEVDDLYRRKHTTFGHLHNSMRSWAEAIEVEQCDLGENPEQQTALATEFSEVREKLRTSLLTRISFINEQMLDYEGREDWPATDKEQARWTDEVTKLHLLFRKLQSEANRLGSDEQPTIFR